jgi:hypothetical protein
MPSASDRNLVGRLRSLLVNDMLAAARPKDVYDGLGIDVSVVDAIKSAQETLDQVFEGHLGRQP